MLFNICCTFSTRYKSTKMKCACFYRFGVMTTNIVEVYNWVIRGLKGMPLVAIVEGMLHGIIGYYQKRHATAVLHCTTMQTPYCLKLMAYMDDKTNKAQQHMVYAFGVHEY